MGTGDFTHPAWREELKEKLVPAESGLYRLRDEYALEEAKMLPGGAPRFVITGEISSIYKKYDKVRKVHSLLILPGLKEAENLSEKLEVIGNLHSDGRPILGLDCREFTGNHAGDNTRWHVRSGTHLDTAFFHVRSIFRI